MRKTFTLELLDWLHQLAIEDEKRAEQEEAKKLHASTNELKTLHESRRIGFLWRADFARVIAGAIRLREVPASGAWKRFRERAGEEAPVEQDRPLPSTGAATCEGSPR
jgi:hypothetical protein